MNALIKPYFEQLIEDRNFTHATGPRPLQVIETYIEELEYLLEQHIGKFDVEICGDMLEIVKE